MRLLPTMVAGSTDSQVVGDFANDYHILVSTSFARNISGTVSLTSSHFGFRLTS